MKKLNKNVQNRVLGRWKMVRSFRNTGIVILFSMIAIFLVKDRLISFFSFKDWEYFPISLLSTLLFIVTIIMIFFWLRSTEGELQMLQDYLSEFIISVPKSTSFIIFGLAVVGGLLCYFSDKITIYTSIFVAYNFLMMWALWTRDKEIKKSLKHARNDTLKTDDRRKAWSIIESFYLERPQLQLSVSQLFLSFISLILGIFGELVKNQNTARLLFVLAYIIMLINIALIETIYIIWRNKRDNALKEEYS